ncbi:MAG TPA: efflux RND transporter periplasmic adaptor subunit [Steroidobacteraceae bacterium]|nr:efflux RND transporter periplasmic adaptor subunit [Steroidobacteraceae bacterium]
MTPPPAADLPPVVSVVSPMPGSIPTRIAVVGTLSARNEMPISPEGEGGRIASVLVEAGDLVKGGQLLAQLDPTVPRSQLAAAEASLAELKASAEVADAEYQRAQRAGGAFSVEESERRRTASVTAHARVDVAAAQVAEARSRLERTRIVAPTAGLVLARSAEVGQVATAGVTVLFRLARNGELEMRAQVAEQDVPRLRDGQIAQVRLSGVSRSFAGRIWQVGAIIDPLSRQGSVRIALPERDRDLRPGAFARADIEVGASVGAIVPQTAVLSDEQGSYVLTVQNDLHLARQPVTVGGAQREGLLITQGLVAGQKVVATAGVFLHPGERVSLAPDAGS